MASKKDELLQRLDSSVLLKLARSVSESPVESGTARAELVRIIKGSLSTEEITRKLKQEKMGSKDYRLTGAELKAGGIGQVFLAISAAMNILAYLENSTILYIDFFWPWAILLPYMAFPLWGFLSSIFVLLFVILLTVSMVKMPRKIGGSVGRATSLFGMIAAIDGIILYSSVNLGLVQFYLSDINVVLAMAYGPLLGVAMALFGAFFLVCHKYSGSGDLWIASGVLYLVNGGFLLEMALSPFPSASIIAAIFGAICFLKGNFPE